MGMTDAKWAEVEAAAEARAGGGMFRLRWYRPCIPEAQRAAARVAAGIEHFPKRGPTMLPEAAFDWPVYRAALAGTGVRHG